MKRNILDRSLTCVRDDMQGGLTSILQRFVVYNAESDTAFTVDPKNQYRSRGVNAARAVKSLKSDRMLIPRVLAGRFSLHAMLLREPVVSDHYLMAYRIALRAD